MEIQALEEQFPHEDGYDIYRYKDFKFMEAPETYYLKLIPPQHDHCEIAMEPKAAKVGMVIDNIDYVNGIGNRSREP